MSGSLVFTSIREDTVTSTGTDGTAVLRLLLSVTLRSLLDSLLFDILIGRFIDLLHTEGKFTPVCKSGTEFLFNVDSIEVTDDSDERGIRFCGRWFDSCIDGNVNDLWVSACLYFGTSSSGVLSIAGSWNVDVETFFIP